MTNSCSGTLNECYNCIRPLSGHRIGIRMTLTGETMGILGNVLREARYIRNTIRTLRSIKHVDMDGSYTAADMFEHWVDRKPDSVAIRFEGREITWREYEETANRYAHWALSQGIERGDTVALLMDNRPEFLFAWLGMAKIGAVSALINSNLLGPQLAHCLNVAGSRHIILGAELADNLDSAREHMDPQQDIWATGGKVDKARDLDDALAQASSDRPQDRREGLTARDNLFYIYTSGTTGNPKAANFSHFRYLMGTHAFGAAARLGEQDRMYVVLPLYHSAGGVIATGATFANGGSVVLRRKFSATEFWDDCVEYDVTAFQYIGELCRYLVNTPEHPKETSHRIRICMGNGLRPEIWEEFLNRFRIPAVIEFYAATEGNIGLINTDGKVGAVGRIPGYMDKVFNVKLIRFDIEREEPIRDEQGFCIECEPGETGEAIGLIPDDPGEARGRFEGYTNKEATERKILQDAFTKGDRWFRSGDLMRRDAEGYFYFIDRIGDTFRWKGENVSTNEVAEVLSVHDAVQEANVYGVEIPGHDGRAGMAAIVPEGQPDLDSLRQHIERNLPRYAQPLFVRIQSQIEVTGTFKHRKVDLVEQGFDPEVVGEPVYFLHPEEDCYVPVDKALHRRICDGEFRL